MPVFIYQKDILEERNQKIKIKKKKIEPNCVNIILVAHEASGDLGFSSGPGGTSTKSTARPAISDSSDATTC